MKGRLAAGALCLLMLTPGVGAAPLTLDEALDHARQPHPEMLAAEAASALARSEQLLAESQDDFRVTLEGALRSGRNPAYDNHFSPDHVVRLNARKTLWDAGRTANAEAAARLEVASSEIQRQDVHAQRRLALMTRFFDVLLSDLQYAAENEYLAVAFIGLENGRDRHQLGQLSAAGLAELEARYQETRLRRNDTERKARERRALLASAMNRPDELPSDLADPTLRNDRELPDFEVLWGQAQESSPRLRMKMQAMSASTKRLEALRAEYRPSLEVEAETAAYSRASSTRDDVRAGLSLVWPIYSGGRMDARIAREQAQFQSLQAQYEGLKLDLRQSLFETWQEIRYLRDTERQARDAEGHYRDQVLERARAEYELELKTNLGTSMADTQMATLRRKAVEYRLALAWERLAMLVGRPLDTLNLEKHP